MSLDRAPAAILVEELHKSFGRVHALRGVSFAVPRGTVVGLLGPNGAGKTTAVRILTTLTRPDSGRALVEARDAVRDAASVRRLIGLAGQATAIQVELTARENLEIIGRLTHLPRPVVRERTASLLSRFDLAEAADRPARTLSGGMQRRLDLAASLIGEPAVLFLDEPTTGLDPRGRLHMWEIVRELSAAGTTILLTTQYMDEADALAGHIIVIDHGRVIAEGAPEELKERAGGDVLEFTVLERSELAGAAAAVSGLNGREPQPDGETGRVTVAVGGASARAMIEVVRRLDAAGIETEGLVLRRPSLDDVFLALTGHQAEHELRGRSGPRRRPAGSAAES
ncbi:MAG TPA: ATP-binding cassette domain-containing protein [Candidatus Binatia bacterium]|nr:ATP-binding cassette domain-containing protein [Candidatus Binatia bacterium]